MKASALRLTKGGSIADVLYPKDSIVVCRNCGKPLYRLQATIYYGESAGNASCRKYAPVTPMDLDDLLQRRDVEAGHRAIIGAMSLEDRRTHCEQIPTLRDGTMADCPSCLQPFVFGRVKNDGDGGAKFNDRAFVIALATIPPVGFARKVTA